MLKWMHRTALELVGQGGLGYSFDPLTNDDHHDEYAAALKGLVPALSRLSFWRMFLDWLDFLGPPSSRRWLAGIVPSKRLQKIKHIVDIMDKNTKDILQKKRDALAAGDEAVVQQVAQGKDIMSILLRANMEASDQERLSEEELLGQMSTLVFAASDTTSSALSRILHLLARNADIQEKLRAEIQEARAKAGGDVPHDELMVLPYMDSVCRETLRLYSPVSFINLPSKTQCSRFPSQSGTSMGTCFRRSTFRKEQKFSLASVLSTLTSPFGEMTRKNGSLNDGSHPCLLR
ncbi:cytochrome P450 [Panus rudis PR-1116 ss-1]|nr:cytochrome P450 [Panus rudis PR-1116 ss-1]